MKTCEICGGLGSFESTDNICPFCGGTKESTPASKGFIEHHISSVIDYFLIGLCE